MTQTAPKIFAPPTTPLRIGWYPRLICLALAFGCAAVVATALRLAPAAEGIGTHEALHLPPCNLLQETNIPCPTCGMTTSFAWFYHGNLLASFYIQPAGFVLAGLAGAMVLLAGYQGLTGRPLHRLLRLFPTRILLFTAIGILLLGWGWKIAIHLMGIDGWH